MDVDVGDFPQVDSADIGDTQLKLGEDRQGHPTSPKTDWRTRTLTSANLPHTIQMGQQWGFAKEVNVVVGEEIMWQEEVSRLINKAILRRTYRIATKCMKVIVENATALVSKQVDDVINPYVGGESYISVFFCCPDANRCSDGSRLPQVLWEPGRLASG